MDVDKACYIHSRGGKIGADGVSSPPDVENIVAALAAAPSGHLILHFHGGLVSHASAFELAGRLEGLYKKAGQPVFFIWESGFFEAIRNNIAELADEPVFKQLLRKLLEYSLQRLGGTDGARSFTPEQVDADQINESLEEFFENPGPDTIPYKNFKPHSDETKSRAAAFGIDVNEIEADLQDDPEFKKALATLPDIPPGTRNALNVPPLPEHRSVFSECMSEKLSERPGHRGFISLFKAAMLLKDILKAILIRYKTGRDHGLYATVVEEIVRNVKVGGSGLNEWGKALQWNRMKQDCDDAFGPDRNLHAGTALLSRIGDKFDRGKGLKRITLVGHSTGAIYISSLLAAADNYLDPRVTVDVVFLAPAITHEHFAMTLQKHGGRIGNFRMFAMRDEWERGDQVWGNDHDLGGPEQDLRRYIYPSSLLYLVSGILESRTQADGSMRDEADTPLLGMERFLANTAVYTDADFPEIAQVRAWLQTRNRSAIWSLAENADPGQNCLSKDHGHFDNDDETLKSLSHILANGF